MFLEAFVDAHAEPNEPAVPLRGRERSELTADSKTLTVRSDVDFPGRAANLFDSGAETYTRI
jgi:hypothetical protein